MANFTGSDNVNENFVGTNGADKFFPGTAFNYYDTVDGRDGVDLLILDYTSSTQSILTAFDIDGVVSTVYRKSDATSGISARNIERFNITGSNFADSLAGGTLNDILIGGAGDDILNGLAGADELYGGNGYDILNGGAGSDKLFGGLGNDFLNGGDGLDRMEGGQGNDVYFVDRTSDIVIELANEGVDRVKSSVSYSLEKFANNVETLELLEGSGAITGIGSSSNNRIEGNSNNNRLNGGGGVDILIGMAGNDLLIGGEGNTRDLLYGGDGDDIFEGGGGADRLEGGAGRDTFRYVSSLDLQADTIVDFDVASDIIEISRKGYGLSGLGSGALAGNKFVLGSSTTNTGATVLYDSDRGLVILDTNGSDAGGRIQLAKIGNGLSLTSSNFLMI